MLAGKPLRDARTRRLDGSRLSPGNTCSIAGLSAKLLRHRANIVAIERSRLLSVPEAAAELKASDAYVRRLLISQRLYGIKVGPVWAIYEEDLQMFKRLRRPPGRPPKAAAPTNEAADARETRLRTSSESASAGSVGLRRKPRRGRKAPEAERK